MDVRDGIIRKIEFKRKELADLELKVRDVQSYVRALEDTLKIIDGGQVTETRGTRADSDVGKSQAALKRAGKPLHISVLLKEIGKNDDKKNRVSLAGTLAGYVRREHVFTRPEPNTFGLIEFGTTEKTSPIILGGKTEENQEPPEDFGGDDDVPF